MAAWRQRTGWQVLAALLTACLLAAGLAGCGGSDATKTATDKTAAADTTASDVLATDGAVDAAAADAPTAWTPPPVAPPDQGTEITAAEWVTASTGTSSSDTIGGAVAAGSFEVPAPGTKAYGVYWKLAKPQPGGALPAGNGTLTYAATMFSVDEDRGLVVRADRAWEVFVDGRKQPGDIYASGSKRVAFAVTAGEHVLVVRGPGGQPMSVGLRTTTHEAVANLQDVTQPDLRVGDAGERWLGVAVLVPGDSVQQVTARVLASDQVAATATPIAALAGGAVTQVPFLVQPKQAPVAAATWKLTLQLDSPGWQHSYTLPIDVAVVAPEANFRQTFRSPDDGSVQVYGVRPPKDFDKTKTYALVESLHGAGVDPMGQAGAYSSRDWMWLIAPTNRRNFGFDWEEWGMWNAMFSLDDATARFQPDPTRIYLTGHSMGGHGTWNVGAHHPGRFALVGPSAGWNSFYTYGGAKKPGFPFSRARAHSDTTAYIGNLAQRAAFVIHGTADSNVPWSEGKAMLEAVSTVTKDVQHHWQEGADHWWDGEVAPGADCVDWSPLFDTMKARTLDPTELTFTFRSPGPWYSPQHSYVTITSSTSPQQDCVLTATAQPPALTTQNVRSMVLDGKALRGKGVQQLAVNGQTYDIPDGPLAVGPQDGKQGLVHGPFNQVLLQPWLIVYPDDDAAARNYAAYLVSVWSLIGNGHGGALPRSQLTEALRDSHNLWWLQPAAGDVELEAWTWDAAGIHGGGKDFADAALLTVVPRGSHLDAVMVVPSAALMDWIMPFSSRAGLPDYLVWTAKGVVATGFYDGDWKLDPKFGAGWQ